MAAGGADQGVGQMGVAIALGRRHAGYGLRRQRAAMAVHQLPAERLGERSRQRGVQPEPGALLHDQRLGPATRHRVHAVAGGIAG